VYSGRAVDLPIGKNKIHLRITFLSTMKLNLSSPLAYSVFYRTKPVYCVRRYVGPAYCVTFDDKKVHICISITIKQIKSTLCYKQVQPSLQTFGIFFDSSQFPKRRRELLGVAHSWFFDLAV